MRTLTISVFVVVVVITLSCVIYSKHTGRVEITKQANEGRNHEIPLVNKVVESNKNSNEGQVDYDNQLIHSSVNEIDNNELGTIPKEDLSSLSRSNFDKKAEKVRSHFRDLMQYFSELERANGKVLDSHPDGNKHIVDIHDSKGSVIGKLLYNKHGKVTQLVEWKNGKQNGMTAFLLGELDFPNDIYHFRDNKLDGPYYQFEKNKEGEIILTSYVEYVDHCSLGYCIGWSLDGELLPGSKIVKEPVPFQGLP